MPLAAMKLGRPVKWIESRRESLMATNHAREVSYDVEIGFDADGRILGMRARDPRRHRRLRAHGGARARGVRRRAPPRPVPRAELRVRPLVAWSPTRRRRARSARPGARSATSPASGSWTRRRARLGLDPAEIRRRNLIRRGRDALRLSAPSRSASTPSTTPATSPRSSTSCCAGWTTRARAPSRRRSTPGRAARAAASASPSTSRRPGSARSRPRRWRRRADGTLHRRHRRLVDGARARDRARPDPRRGARAARPRASTSATPTPPPSRAASAPTARAAPSPRATPRTSPPAKLIAEARSRAAARLGVAEADVTLRARRALGADGRRVTLAELAAERRLAAGASFEVPKITYAGCAAAVVLDVDPETGAITLAASWSGADVGRAVNPALVDGQLVGGVAFGIGNALHESLAYDARRPAPHRHADGLRAARAPPTSRPSTASTRRCGDHEPARPARARRVRQSRASAPPSPTRSATRSAARSCRSPRCR